MSKLYSPDRYCNKKSIIICLCLSRGDSDGHHDDQLSGIVKSRLSQMQFEGKKVQDLQYAIIINAW